jgi:DNA-binding FadR family transcriptional regulator
MTARLPTLLEPLELRSASQHIADRLVTAIALGEFVPGQRLPTERALAAMLGVSRKTIREGLHALAGDGYVEIQRGRSGGAVVRESWLPASADSVRRTLGETWTSLEWLFDLRHLVEPLIAQTASERRRPEDVRRIQQALADYRGAPDREASRAADAALHAAIADATQNPYLANLSRQIRTQVSLGFQAEPYSESIRGTAVVQHGELVDAIVGGDSVRAAEIAKEHFLLTERALRELASRVEERGAT